MGACEYMWVYRGCTCVYVRMYAITHRCVRGGTLTDVFTLHTLCGCRWGLDRLPCFRITILDLFKEGDFDLPYPLKQLSFIGLQLFSFMALDYLKVFR